MSVELYGNTIIIKNDNLSTQYVNRSYINGWEYNLSEDNITEEYFNKIEGIFGNMSLYEFIQKCLLNKDGFYSLFINYEFKIGYDKDLDYPTIMLLLI